MLQRPCCNRAYGFTLIEILVCVLIIGVLISIALPSLARARTAARLTKSTANARTLATTITAFAESRAGRYPVTETGVLYPTDSNAFLVAFPHWQVFETWSGVIYNELPYEQNIDIYLAPSATSRRTAASGSVQNWPSSYVYSMSFAGHPVLWAQTPPPGDPTSLQRAARTHEVAFPSQKALLWDEEASYLPTAQRDALGDRLSVVPVALADGAVKQYAPADATTPVSRPIDGPRQVNRLHNTRDGVRGVDF